MQFLLKEEIESLASLVKALDQVSEISTDTTVFDTNGDILGKIRFNPDVAAYAFYVAEWNDALDK
jgi:hypothetical protein